MKKVESLDIAGNGYAKHKKNKENKKEPVPGRQQESDDDGTTSTVNFNVAAQVTLLKTHLDAICEKSGEKVRVLVNSAPNFPAIFKLEDLNDFLSKFSLKINSSDLKPVLGMFGIDPDKLELEISRVFYTAYLSGATEKDSSEFAFKITIRNNIDETNQKSSIFTFNSLSFAVWNITDPALLKGMNLMSIDDILKNIK